MSKVDATSQEFNWLLRCIEMADGWRCGGDELIDALNELLDACERTTPDRFVGDYSGFPFTVRDSHNVRNQPRAAEAVTVFGAYLSSVSSTSQVQALTARKKVLNLDQ